VFKKKAPNYSLLLNHYSTRPALYCQPKILAEILAQNNPDQAKTFAQSAYDKAKKMHYH
jgi:hypothetical protein